MRETRSIPFFEFVPLLKGKHDARTAIFQVAIGGTSARGHNVAFVISPQEAFQVHDVDTGSLLFHVFSFRDVFEDYEHIVIQLSDKCTLCNQSHLIKLA